MQHQSETEFEKYLEEKLEPINDNEKKEAIENANNYIDLIVEILADRLSK